MDHTLGHNSQFNKFKRIEIIYYVHTDHNGIKLEISNRKTGRKQQQYTFK